MLLRGLQMTEYRDVKRCWFCHSPDWVYRVGIIENELYFCSPCWKRARQARKKNPRVKE